jgi:hypothetical protein
MHELSPWPYGELPSITDYQYGSVRYVVQSTEDGYYGFAFRDGRKVANMIGPYRQRTACEQAVRSAAPPGKFAA